MNKSTKNASRFMGRNGILAVGVIIVLLVTGIFFLLNSSGKAREEKSIAVLPFKNLSLDTLDIAYSDGFWNQVIIALDKIKVFDVRSGVSSGQYRNPGKPIPEVGRELDADFIIEGSVDKEGDQIKVWVQLIEAKSDTHIWAEEYTFKLGETFDKLNDIAKYVAYKLNIIILPTEQADVEQKCTSNAEAWYNFIKAEYLMDAERGGDPAWALPYRRKTIEIDPAWPDAYVRLSQTLRIMYRSDPREEYLKESLQAAEKAHSLRPGPDTWMELTECYLDSGNRVKAKECFMKVKNGFLDDYYMNFKLGRACRTFGMWKEAVDRLLRVHQEQPQNVQNNFVLGQTYELLRDFGKAEYYYNQGIVFNPHFTINFYGLADISLKSKGDTRQAREIIEKANKDNPWVDDNLMQAYYQYVMINIYEGKYQEALDELSKWFYPFPRWYPPYYYRPKYLMYAWVYGYSGNTGPARAYYDSTLIFVEKSIKEFPKYQRDPAVYACLGIAFAGVGNTGRAIEMADKAVGMLEDAPNRFLGPFIMEDVALIYTKTGQHKEALKVLRLLLSEPGPLTVKLLEIDPKWEPLKGYPKYKKMLKKYSI